MHALLSAACHVIPTEPMVVFSIAHALWDFLPEFFLGCGANRRSFHYFDVRVL